MEGLEEVRLDQVRFILLVPSKTLLNHLMYFCANPIIDPEEGERFGVMLMGPPSDSVKYLWWVAHNHENVQYSDACSRTSGWLTGNPVWAEP